MRREEERGGATDKGEGKKRTKHGERGRKGERKKRENECSKERGRRGE